MYQILKISQSGLSPLFWRGLGLKNNKGGINPGIVLMTTPRFERLRAVLNIIIIIFDEFL